MLTTRDLPTASAIRAKPNPTTAALSRLCGGYWLAIDRSTGLHWVVEAASVRAATGIGHAATQQFAFGLADVYSRAGQPVFQIEKLDELTWEVPGERLRVREGAYRGSVIVLERLDDLDAPTLSLAAVLRQYENGERMLVMHAGHNQYLETSEALLPTGVWEIDRELEQIEATIEARRSLHGPSDGSAGVLRHLSRQLDTIARNAQIDSCVWVAVLREQIWLLGRELAG